MSPVRGMFTLTIPRTAKLSQACEAHVRCGGPVTPPPLSIIAETRKDLEMPANKPAPAPAEAPKNSYTNWKAFENAKVVPVVMICDVIDRHPADESCKTRLVPTAENLMKHFSAEHGGGFQIKFKQTDGKPWPGWKQLDEAKFEVVDLRCEVCNRSVEISARDILNHIRPHQGKFRGAYQNFRDTFFLQIQNTPVNRPDDDDSCSSEDSE